jgi:hypothetical protein
MPVRTTGRGAVRSFHWLSARFTAGPRLAGDELAVAFLRAHLAVVDRHLAARQGEARQALHRVPSNTL